MQAWPFVVCWVPAMTALYPAAAARQVRAVMERMLCRLEVRAARQELRRAARAAKAGAATAAEDRRRRPRPAAVPGAQHRASSSAAAERQPPRGRWRTKARQAAAGGSGRAPGSKALLDRKAAAEAALITR
jgi:hypothetical protein